VGAEDPHGFAGLDQQCLIAAERSQRADDGVKRRPRPRGLARAAIDDQILRPLGDLGIQVVHQHPQRRFLLPTAARDDASAWRADHAFANGSLYGCQ
jgi:hypothetical protein